MAAPAKGAEFLKLFGSLFEHGSDGVILGRPDGTVLRANAAACRMLALSESEMVRRGRSGIMVDDTAFRDWLTARSRDGLARGLLRFRAADGTTLPCETISAMVLGPDGELQTFVVFRDVSEELRTRAELETRDAVLSAIFEASSDGLLAVDHAGKVLRANRRFQEICRIPDEVLASGDDGRLVEHVLGQLVDPEAFLAGVRKVYGSSESSRDEIPLRDGRVLERSSVPLRTAGAQGRLWTFRDVTERKHADEEKRAREAKLTAYFNSPGVGVVVTEIRENFSEVNEAYCRRLGYTREEIVGKTWRDFTHPDDLARDGRIIERMIGGEFDAYAWDKRYIRKDGSILWVLISLSCTRFPDGSPRYVVAIEQDITDRKLAEESLRASEARFRTLADEAPVGIFEDDAAGMPVYLNRAGRQMLGLLDGPVSAERWGEVMHPDDQPRAQRAWADGVAGGVGFSGDFRAVRPDGQCVEVHLTASPLHDPSGRVTGFIGVMADMTDFRRAERAIAEKRDELEVILRTALDGFWIVDGDARLLEVNDAACAMLGYSREEMLRLRVPDIEAAERPEDTRRHIERMRASGWDRFTSRHRRKDGTLVDVEASVQFLPLAGGRFVCFVRDVTGKRQAEEQLRQSQKMEAVGRLAGGVAHDFNNLLTVMITSSQFALDAAPAGSTLRADIEEFRGAAEKARVLTQQLLAFGRRQVLVPRTVQLNEVILDTERLLQRLLGEHVILRTELAPGLAPIHADPGQIQQVIMNLAINAQDAMPRGGTLTIRTSQRETAAGDPAEVREAGPGSWVVLSVEDTGTGIDAETRAHIFEPFFTTKPVGKGTGLGLSTVFGIVKQSGGAIRVDSEPGKGTRFHVLLPRTAEAPVATAPPGATAGEAPVPGVTGQTVIVVEDQADVRRATERMLRRAGFDVIGAGSLDEALARVDGHPRLPAILLTDVRMPVHSGPEVSAAIAERVPHIKTIYMSGYSGEEIETIGGLPSGSLFVQKPFTAEEFAAKVRSAIG